MTEQTLKQIYQHNIDFWKQKEAEWKKMAADSRKHWKETERMLRKLEAEKK